MKMLAFNTTTELCSVALMIEKDIYTRSSIASRLHTARILPMIDHLLSESEISLQSLDCIIFDCGPGNYTGVRIGISIAQGLAFGVDLPLIKVSSLEVLAQGAWRFFSAKKVITTLDARMNELYWAGYCRNIDDTWTESNDKSLISGVFISKLVDVCALEDNWMLVGTGWNNYSILSCPNRNSFFFKSVMFPDAQDMIPLGLHKWKNKIFLNPEFVRPIYLRKNFYKKYTYINQ